MDKGFWKRALALLVVLLGTYAEASLSRHMDDFIKVVKQVEGGGQGAEPLAVLRRLRGAAGLDDALARHFLGDADPDGAGMRPGLADRVRKFVRHGVTKDAREEGVVLAPDGTTVALGPLLLGIEAGLLSRSRRRVRGLHLFSLAEDLSRSLSRGSPPMQLGPDGCWDSVASPRVFTLSGSPYALTAARVNGGMDGVVLGAEVSAKPRRPRKLSGLLTAYYCHRLEKDGAGAAPRLVSQRRRENFWGLVAPPVLARQVVKSLEVQARLTGPPEMDPPHIKQLAPAVKDGMKAFFHKYMDCPPIIPRCMWGAEPYRGTPTNLSLPLSFMYVHHTHTPSRPCLTFQQCAADMRSMQRFHQEDRGWSDIGYSFVAGSDGYIYEGRGWHWQGAHTLGHNAKGYGVSFIGDYSASLPSQHAMGLVRRQLATCAVGGGRLVSDFVLQGHRQVVSTSCPGDALYDEIRGWEHFGDVKK